MKILFESGSTAVGGAERVILRIAKHLRKVRPDWQVDAVILCQHGGLEQEYRATFHNVWDEFLPYRLSDLRITELIKEHGYDIVHAIDSFELTAKAAAVCHGVKFLQNVFPNCAKSPFAPSKEWLANTDNPYSAFITEFHGNLQYIPKPGRPPHVLDVIHNGIDTNFWCPGTEDRTIDVLWTARTDAEKGIGIALELVPILAERGLIYYIITSEHDGPQRELDLLQREYPHFHSLACLPPEMLRKFYRHSKIFIQTSSVEGMPATPLEAAACGCWPLCSAVDGVAEVFDDYSEVCLVQPPFTAQKFAERIFGILDDVELSGAEWNCEGMQQPRWLVCGNYSLDRMVDAYLALYERLVQ